MFLDVTLVPEAREEAMRILESWRAEHSRYYGTPEGSSGHRYGGFGYAAVPHGGRWLTSGLNYHAIQMTPDGVRVTYAGRRHGMREELRTLLIRYWGLGGDRHWIERMHAYVTHEPEWAPWETLSDRAEERR